MARLIPVLLYLLLHTGMRAQVCDPAGNMVVYSNYDGGALTINVDQNIPDLRIGICTYEAVTVTITGPFASNITEVIYAGFDGTNGPCGNNPPTTTISGVPPGIVTMYSNTLGNIAIANYLGEELLPGFNVVNCIAGAEGACSTSTQGGGNSAPQIVQFFLAEFDPGSVLYAHQVQYGCFNGAFNVSDGGNCCLTATGTPPNPIYIGDATYDLIPWTDSLLCGGSITIDLSYYTGIYSVLWGDGSAAESFTITAPGTYTVEVGDYCHYAGATLLVDTVVVLPCCQPLDVDTFVVPISCAGSADGAITVIPAGVNGPYSYLWNTTPPQAGPTAGGLAAGSYTVQVTDNAGCDTLLAFLLPDPPPLLVELDGPSDLCPGEAGTFAAMASGGTGAIGISWGAGASGPLVQLAFPATAVLAATATDANGCTAGDSLLVVVASPDEGIFVPNVFSPNGDGINDVFRPSVPGGIAGGELRILDRWGVEVHASAADGPGWDGRMNGGPVPDGVYVYLLRVEAPCLADGRMEVRGHITVLR